MCLPQSYGSSPSPRSNLVKRNQPLFLSTLYSFAHQLEVPGSMPYGPVRFLPRRYLFIPYANKFHALHWYKSQVFCYEVLRIQQRASLGMPPCPALDLSSPRPSGCCPRCPHACSPFSLLCAVTAREGKHLPTPLSSMYWPQRHRRTAGFAGPHSGSIQWLAVPARRAYRRLCAGAQVRPGRHV